MIEGGCFCGAIRYQIEEPVTQVVNCHCTMCRKTSGAPVVTWLVVPAARFAYTHGEPTRLRSSERGTRYFCNTCGTPVTCIVQAHPDYVDVTLGSLDDPRPFTPQSDIHTDTRLPWLAHHAAQ